MRSKKGKKKPDFDRINEFLNQSWIEFQRMQEESILNELLGDFKVKLKPKPWSPVGGQSVHCAGRSKYGIVGPKELSHGVFTGADRTWYRVKLPTGQDDYFQLEQLSPYETSVEEIVRRLRA